jgi:hypothetical protein
MSSNATLYSVDVSTTTHAQKMLAQHVCGAQAYGLNPEHLPGDDDHPQQPVQRFTE